jgi:potassium uptake TrkH family protein
VPQVQIGARGGRSLTDHPARFVVAAFVVAIAIGTMLLLLPASSADGETTGLLTAVFTATSAICVTGLAVADTSTHWSPLGQVVILGLIQVGGIGFMTIMSLIILVTSHRLGLRRTLAAHTERRSLSLGDMREVLRGVAIVTATVEMVVAIVLILRFVLTYDYSIPRAIWHGVFHAVSAFNNAGFSLYSDSFMGFADDALLLGVTMIAIVVGGLGFPVLVDLFRRWRARQRAAPTRLTLHSRLTLAVSAALLAFGVVAILVFEWRNPATLGPMSLGDKGLAGLFSAVTPRTAGFSVIDTGAMTEEGLLSTIFLMFVGAGSAGTSGGIRVTTFALLILVVLAELRGQADVNAGGRRIPQEAQRQATTVAALGLAVVLVVNLVLAVSMNLPLTVTLFEAVSAFGTVGLSTGITPEVPGVGQVGIIMTMLIGRVGPATLGSALILRRRARQFRYAEEGPLVG